MSRSERDSFAVVPGEDPPVRPRVVDEADEVLTTYGWQLTGGGAVAILLWAATGYFEMNLSPFWVVGVILILLMLYVVPVTREPRLARDVLRRWDDLRVERALESSGVYDDPRLEVAEAMADRVIRHPSVDARTRSATRAMIAKLKLVLRDLRRVSYLAEAKTALDERSATRSISDLQDLLDARMAEILGQIAELHRTVVLRDAVSLERAVGNVEDLLRELEAEREVERLLTEAERD
ncbi:MAG: hypothetical protein PVJ04_00445 [Gemmatimonadota bacterium]|jgi:hypothetical protein